MMLRFFLSYLMSVKRFLLAFWFIIGFFLWKSVSNLLYMIRNCGTIFLNFSRVLWRVDSGNEIFRNRTETVHNSTETQVTHKRNEVSWFFFHFVSIFPIAWNQRSSHSRANSSINPVTQCHVLPRAASEAGIPVDTQGTLSYLMIPGEAIDFHFWAGSTITEIIEFSPWMGFPVITEIRDSAGRNASATSRFVLLILRQLCNTQTPFPPKCFEAKSLRALCGTILRCKIWCLFNMPIWWKIAAEVASYNSFRRK